MYKSRTSLPYSRIGFTVESKYLNTMQVLRSKFMIPLLLLVLNRPDFP